jgi:hypothetical protein
VPFFCNLSSERVVRRYIHLGALSVVTVIMILNFSINPSSADPICPFCYGSVATSIDGSHVSMGGAMRETQDSADARSLELCGNGGGASCTVVYRFRFGACGAAATGHNDETGRVGWGTGRTRTEAMQKCIAQGVYCRLDYFECTRSASAGG